MTSGVLSTSWLLSYGASTRCSIPGLSKPPLMFFSFEGIDGSGKSTQARLLSSALRKRGHDVVDVREPGGTDLAERIRAILLNPACQITPRAELLLFSAARAQLTDDVIRPALERGAVVIADRFFDSSTAYQGGGRGLTSTKWMESLHTFATNDLAPDRTYLFDLDVGTAVMRRQHRESDRIEKAGMDFYSAVRQSYLSIAASEPQRVRMFDSRLAIQELHERVLTDARWLMET